MNHRSRVLGIGMSVPSRVVTNHELASMMETSNEWIIERTGIEERHWVSEGETGTTLATAASQQALERAGLVPRDIDMIILATLSPDFNFPGTGVFVQRSLGLKDIPCLDIRQQCTGFIYGLSIADAYIRTGMFRNILVIGAEVHSTGLDVSTQGRDVTVLFGDAGGDHGRHGDEQAAAHRHRHGDSAPGQPANQSDGHADDRSATREVTQQHSEIWQYDSCLDSHLHERGSRARQDQARKSGVSRGVRRR